MTLVDTSVWVEHLRSGSSRLGSLLQAGDVVTHPFVIGEIACGNLHQRALVLRLLATLPQVVMADHVETMALLERRALFGRGLGWVDVHMLGSCLLSGRRLWTLDRRLREAAGDLGCAASPGP